MDLVSGFKIGDFVTVIVNYESQQYDLMIRVTDDMMYKRKDGRSFFNIHSESLIHEVRLLTGLFNEVIHLTVLLKNNAS